MKTLSDIWNWFDGAKTIIGTVILILSAFFSEVLIGIWHISGSWVAPTASTLNWVGTAISGTGLVHKYIKSRQTP